MYERRVLLFQAGSGSWVLKIFFFLPPSGQKLCMSVCEMNENHACGQQVGPTSFPTWTREKAASSTMQAWFMGSCQA